jgi:hypothetical protein
MATKTEWFRYAEQRAHPHDRGSRGPAPTGARRSEPARSTKAVYALEECAGRPSRKSTRKSANRQKTDVQFRLKKREAEVRPRPQS